MGFGYLFIGAFFLIFQPMGSMGILPDLSIIAIAPLFSAVNRLYHYCPDCGGFRLARGVLLPLSAFSIASLALSVLKITDWLTPTADTYFAHPVYCLSAALASLFMIFTFTGVYKLAHQVELPKLSARAVRVITVNCVYMLVNTVSTIISVVVAARGMESGTLSLMGAYLGMFSMLLFYISLFVNLAFIFTCYMRICLEGDEDMPYREDIFDKIIAWTKRNKK